MERCGGYEALGDVERFDGIKGLDVARYAALRFQIASLGGRVKPDHGEN
jgi:hypothetical protein